jgi:hypothetical protein
MAGPRTEEQPASHTCPRFIDQKIHRRKVVHNQIEIEVKRLRFARVYNIHFSARLAKYTTYISACRKDTLRPRLAHNSFNATLSPRFGITVLSIWMGSVG